MRFEKGYLTFQNAQQSLKRLFHSLLCKTKPFYRTPATQDRCCPGGPAEKTYRAIQCFGASLEEGPENSQRLTKTLPLLHGLHFMHQWSVKADTFMLEALKFVNN